MSGGISVGDAFSGYGLLGTVVADSEQASKTLDALTVQVGDGLVSTTYGGLGAQASVSLSLSPAIAASTALQSGIGAASGKMQVAQTALTSINSIVSTLYAATDTLNGLDASDVDSTAVQAQDALSQVAGLLDSTDGSVYVFAGQDSGNPPVPDPDDIWSSGFAIQIQSAVGGLAGSGSASVIASTLATASSNAAGTSPFSAALSQSAAAVDALQTTVQTTVQTGPGQQVPTGILASANSDVASTGTSTTGSYMRDILRGLATLGSLSSSQVNTPGFADVVADVRTSLGNALTALNQDAGVMGNRQSQLTAAQTRLQDAATSMTAQVGNVQNVDMTSTISSLTAAQTRLQASYQLISTIQSLSLTKYIGTGG